MKYDGVNLTKEEMREQIDAYLGIDGELVKVIKSLKSKGFKTALLSNANASFFERKIYPTYPEFEDVLDELTISAEIGMLKHYKDIYEYTLKKINSKPEESLFIDDSKTNVDTAIDLDIQGFVYTNKDFFTDYLKSIGINLN